MRAGMRQGEHRVIADLPGVADDVDVERARAESLGPDPAEVRLDPVGGVEQFPGPQAGLHDEHRVQVIGLGGAADRVGLVNGRDGQHVSVRKPADRGDACLKGTQPVAQVAADGEDRAPPRVHGRLATAGASAPCHAATTRTASAFAGTWCTRTHQAPAAAASAVVATVAPSRPAKGLGVPS